MKKKGKERNKKSRIREEKKNYANEQTMKQVYMIDILILMACQLVLGYFMSWSSLHIYVDIFVLFFVLRYYFFALSHQIPIFLKQIYLTDSLVILPSTTTRGQSRPGSNDNEGVFHTPRSSALESYHQVQFSVISKRFLFFLRRSIPSIVHC